MVGGVPVGLALRDLFYAAGLGFLLCVGYSAARMLLGSGKAVCFICDAAVLAVGALLYRSAAMSPFSCRPAALVYAGGMCAVFFGQPRRTGASAFRRRSVRSLVPGLAVRNAVARGAAPVCGCGFGAFSACAYGAQRRPCEKKPGGQKEKVAKQRPRVV